jgi:uncharacterized protein (TIGR03437 family)
MMKRPNCLPALLLAIPLAIPAFAQPQIGGGTCASSTLSGTYSLSLNGRALEPLSQASFANALQGVGTATFDGLSKVTFTLTENAAAALGTAVTLAGTYSLQSNCVGTLSITSGDTANFNLVAYDSGADYLITGEDGTYSFNGSGGTMPTAACATMTFNGTYSFNGNGFGLQSHAVNGANYISGLMTFDGAGNVTAANWVLNGQSGLPATDTLTGTYTVAAGCTATAALKDTSGNAFTAAFTITGATGSFIVTVASNAPISNTTLMFIGSGRPAATSCSVATVSGTYSLVLAGRQIGALGIEASYQSVGTASFDGNGNVTFTLAGATNSGGATQNWSGIYALPANCMGTLTINKGDTAASTAVFTMIPYNTGKDFTITGADSNYAYSGTGAQQPAACPASTLSGQFPFSGNGFALSAGSITQVNSTAGLFTFDGVSAITASWTVSTNILNTSDNSLAGTYTFSPSSCTGSATLTDSSGASYQMAFTMTSPTAAGFSAVISNASSLSTAAGHAAFVNPGLAIELAAGSGLPVPPGSLFSIYGTNMSTGQGGATGFPLPATVQSASVTVNGETVPLYFVDKTLINAQMPLDVTPGVATLVVKNGTTVSNAVAINVSATAAPGVFIYGNNHAVAQNLPSYTENSESAQAPVGSTVVVYFTGGGPVNGQSSLVSGHATPAADFGVTETYGVTIGGVAAAVDYIGLVPTAVGGFYQANVVVPTVSAGDHPLVITIGGKASNSTTISVK